MSLPAASAAEVSAPTHWAFYLTPSLCLQPHSHQEADARELVAVRKPLQMVTVREAGTGELSWHFLSYRTLVSEGGTWEAPKVSGKATSGGNSVQAARMWLLALRHLCLGSPVPKPVMGMGGGG